MRSMATYALMLSLASIGGGLVGATTPATASEPEPEEGMLYHAEPMRLPMAEFGSDIITATTTDVEVADIDGDGRGDILAAWYANHESDRSQHLRRLSVFRNVGCSFEPFAEFDLYEYNADSHALSVFRNGTSDIGTGDYDGDGDVDFAVTPFYGDELWIFENLGDGEFVQYLRFPFGINSPAIFITPPEVAAGDFDGDGRDDLVYIADPLQHIDGQPLHFWTTNGSIADMSRIDWWGPIDAPWVQWTRALTVTDFDGDGRDDVCFCGSIDPPYEDTPALVLWHNLDVDSLFFEAHYEYPTMLSSDVDHVRFTPGGRPGLVLADLHGFRMQYWAPSAIETGRLDFTYRTYEIGYSCPSHDRGMTGIVADVDGDGSPDLVTKQKRGSAACNTQIEFTLSSDGGADWSRMVPAPLDVSGYDNFQYNQLLRPRNLAVADLMGNALPEIVAGFEAVPAAPSVRSGSWLELAMWHGCVGDANCDGRTTCADVKAAKARVGTCAGDPNYAADADLNKDGCVDLADVDIALANVGCGCLAPPGHCKGDMNCDCLVDLNDISPLLLALGGPEGYYAAYPDCDWLNGDLNGDQDVTYSDISMFLEVLGT